MSDDQIEAMQEEIFRRMAGEILEFTDRMNGSLDQSRRNDRLGREGALDLLTRLTYCSGLVRKYLEHIDQVDEAKPLTMPEALEAFRVQGPGRA